MDKILSTVKERVLKYLEMNGISRESFYRQTGFSASNFKGSGLRSALGSDKIGEILRIYPDLNPEWLLTGRGAMRNQVCSNAKGIVAYPAVAEKFDGDVADAAAEYQPAKPRCALQSVPLCEFNPDGGLSCLFSVPRPIPVCLLGLPEVPVCDGALRIAGDSLMPLFGDGDIVLYREVRSIAEGLLAGKTYLFSFGSDSGEHTVLRTVRKSRNVGQVRLDSPDPRLVSIDIPVSDIRRAVLVCGGIRYSTIY